MTDLSQQATLHSVAAGKSIGTRAELYDSVFVVLRGTVGIRVTTENGQHPLVMELGVGETVRVLGCDAGEGVEVDATATGSRAEVCLIPESCFLRVCSVCPELGVRLAQQAWHRALANSAEHAELGSLPVPERVCRVLADLAERDPDHVVRESQVRIAERAWTTREQVNRVLHDLPVRGLIEHAPFSREIRVPDPNRLRCLCG